MKPLLIIKTGQTVESLRANGEDFEDWIIEGSGLEHGGFRIAEVFRDEPIEGEPDDYAGVLVTGSPAYVTDRAGWSESSADFLRRCVDDSVPTLAICYGHQLLAHALGGEVGFHPGGREIGTVPVRLTSAGRNDSLLGQLPASFDAQVSHQQSVLELPEGAVLLAENDFEPHQAFRVGDCAWGVQFHPEFSARVVAAYVDERCQALSDEGLDPEVIRARVRDTEAAASLLWRFRELVERSR